MLNDQKQKHEKKILHLRREDGAIFYKSEELNLRTLPLRSTSFHVDDNWDTLFLVNSKDQ